MAQLVVPSDPPRTRTRTPRRVRLLSRHRTSATPTTASTARTDGADQRATLAHVRVLEATLEEQVRRVSELTTELESMRSRPQENVRHISATVEGLRVAFGKDPLAQRLLSRVDAALDRLVEPGELVRVPLPEVVAEPTAPPRPAVAKADNSVETPADASEGAEPVASPAETRVLPVPAPPEPTTQLRRRGFRR